MLLITVDVCIGNRKLGRKTETKVQKMLLDCRRGLGFNIYALVNITTLRAFLIGLLGRDIARTIHH